MKGFATVLDTSLHHNEGEQGCLVAFTHCVLQPVGIVYVDNVGSVYGDDDKHENETDNKDGGYNKLCQQL